MLAFQNLEFKILADFKIEAFQDRECKIFGALKILADLTIIAFENPELKIFADFKDLSFLKSWI